MNEPKDELVHESYEVRITDAEIHVMDVCVQAMERHLPGDEGARRRVVWWLNEKFRGVAP